MLLSGAWLGLLDRHNFAAFSPMRSVVFVSVWMGTRFVISFLTLGMLFSGKQLLYDTVK